MDKQFADKYSLPDVSAPVTSLPHIVGIGASTTLQTAPKGFKGAPGYERLTSVLERAHDQAAYGKGAERHGNGKAFHNQPLRDLIRLHGVGFATGQASKKASEALRLPTVERQVAELLGSIVYLCGAINAIEDGEK